MPASSRSAAPAAFLTVVLLLCLLSGKALGRDILSIPGTGDCQDLLRILAQRFGKANPDLEVAVPDSTGSGGGIKAVGEGQALMARTARPLQDQEAKYGLTSLPFAAVPVVFAAHLKARTLRGLSRDQACAVFSGAPADWKDLGAAPGKIYPIFREPGDSCLRVLAEAAPCFQKTVSPAKVFYTTPEAVDALSENPGALAYVPLTALAAYPGLTVLEFESAAPTLENVRSGRYPLSLRMNMVFRDPGPAGRRFLDFLFSPEAGRIMEAHGAAPLPRGR